MGRILTLRGSIDTTVNNTIVAEKLALSYESPDRTRGWKVTGAWLWLGDVGAQNNIISNNNPVLYGSLSTDQLPFPVRTAAVTTIDDNRLFGWTSCHYRGFDTGNYYVGHATVPADQSFLIDKDRIITNELYVYAGFLANGGLTLPAPVKINYMIALEEVKLDPSQSVLQQLKGIGQDIVN